MSALRRSEKFVLLLSLGLFAVFSITLLQSNETESAIASPSTEPRLTTASLESHPNRNTILSDHILFFNRIPKTGSEMLVLLLQWLQGVNGFRHVRLKNGYRRRLPLNQQEELVGEVMTITRRQAVPVSFDRHVYFTNFSAFDQQPPIFLNMVRNPVDKLISRFYYGRVTANPLNPDIKFSKPTAPPKHFKFGRFEDCFESGDPECVLQQGKPYDLSVPYFCGHHRQCMILNDRWALARAKKNIEQFFPIVGVLEQLNATLSVLQTKLPLFFQGVLDMYYHELLEPHKNANRLRPRTIDPFLRKQLGNALETEFDLYYWIQARLLKQSTEI